MKSQRKLMSCVTVLLLINPLLWVPTILEAGSTQYGSQFGQRSTFSPGDAVTIKFLELEVGGASSGVAELASGDYSIDRAGYIQLPVIGPMKVVGHTEETLKKSLKSGFSAYLHNPIITVRPLIRLTMQGAFNRPGSYRIDPNASLWALVEMAGGPSVSADIQKMWVERGGKVVIENLLRAFEHGYSLQEVGIRSGDQIMVPPRGGVTIKDIMGYMSFVFSAILLTIRISDRL